MDCDWRPNLGDTDCDDELIVEFAESIGFDFYKTYYEENREEIEEMDDFKEEGYVYAVQGLFIEGGLTKYDMDYFLKEHTGRSFFEEQYQKRLREIASDDSEFKCI